jgi:hypothetical protein
LSGRSEEHFAIFELPTKSKKAPLPNRSPNRLSTQKFDDTKRIKHLSTFYTNIMKTPPQRTAAILLKSQK